MSIYTRRGDKGETRIYGTRTSISKTDRRVVALGAIDELNAQLGLASSFLAPRDRLKHRVSRVQEILFRINSELAMASGFKLRKSSTARLEKWVDFYWNKMPPLANFIFPGGTPAGAQFQVARTVCRRAERAVLRLDQELKSLPRAKRGVNSNILSYLNRLSDVLHTLSRWVNHQAGIKDDIWRTK